MKHRRIFTTICWTLQQFHISWAIIVSFWVCIVLSAPVLDNIKLEVVHPEDGGAMILSALTDSKGEHGKLIVEVANTGYVSESYRVQVYSCPQLMPKVGGHLSSKPKTIHAQQVEQFKFNIHFGSHGRAKLVEPTWCEVHVINSVKELIAIRQVLLSPMDTCICYLNCECACASDSMRCSILSEKDSITAGITDPGLLEEVNSDFGILGMEPLTKSAKAHPLLAIIIFLLLLLLLGFCKGVIGQCFKLCPCCECCEQNFIGKLGLGYFYNKPRQLVKYYEKQYSNLAVVYVDGVPVDPITRQPTVERLSPGELLAYNTILLVSWPCVCCHWMVHKCCVDSTEDENRDQSRKKTRNNYQTLPRRYSSDDLIEMEPFTKQNGPRKPTGFPRGEPADLDEDDDEEIVHYSRTGSHSASRQRDQRRSRPEGGSEDHKQYGLSFFMNADRLGSGSFVSRKDSNMSLTNIREDRSTEYMYRRTSAGQQEYAAKLNSNKVTRPESSSSNIVACQSSNLASKLGSWHRQPSDWSLHDSRDNLGNQERSKKTWFHSADVHTRF